MKRTRPPLGTLSCYPGLEEGVTAPAFHSDALDNTTCLWRLHEDAMNAPWGSSNNDKLARKGRRQGQTFSFV